MLLQKKLNKVILIWIIILSIMAYNPSFSSDINIVTADKITITAYQYSMSLFNQKYNFKLRAKSKNY